MNADEFSAYDEIRPAPDGQSRVELLCQGEYSQGNFWYQLVLDRRDTGREVVDAGAWSADGRYFAVAEIPAGTNPRQGRFAALVIDAEQNLACTQIHPEGYGLLPQAFDGHKLICRVWQTGATWELDAAALDGWLPLIS
jgi:hypothetical protein